VIEHLALGFSPSIALSIFEIVANPRFDEVAHQLSHLIQREKLSSPMRPGNLAIWKDGSDFGIHQSAGTVVLKSFFVKLTKSSEMALRPVYG
jgi:hypothetical protein